MKNRFLMSSLTFIMVLTTALFTSVLLLEERVVSYLTQVVINPTQFETNLEQAVEVAEFDFSIIEELGLLGVMPYIDADVFPIGELIIPAVEIHLPIFHGVSEAHISLGAATLTPEARMGQGNYSLASHYMPWGMLFGTLYQIQVGDLIVLRDETYLYLYKAISNEIISAYLVEIIDVVPDKKLVTLITCTPDGQQRVAVQGAFIERILISDGGVIETPELINLEIELTAFLEIESIQFPWLFVLFAIIGSLSLAGLITWMVSRKKL